MARTIRRAPRRQGGEGTMEAIVAACPGERRRRLVRGLLSESVEAAWGWLPGSRKTVNEMAQANALSSGTAPKSADSQAAEGMS